jgi:hypothetical protein
VVKRIETAIWEEKKEEILIFLFLRASDYIQRWEIGSWQNLEFINALIFDSGGQVMEII